MKIWSIPSCRFPEEVSDITRVLPRLEEIFVLMKAGLEEVKDEIKQVRHEFKQLKDEIKQQEISQDLRLRGDIMDVRNIMDVRACRTNRSPFQLARLLAQRKEEL